MFVKINLYSLNKNQKFWSSMTVAGTEAICIYDIQ